MKLLVFDIETIPQNEERLLALAPEFRAAANLKDPEKIAASIAEKRSRYMADAALDWKTAEIVLIGIGDEANDYSYYDDDEASNIRNFLELVHTALINGARVGGHNVKGFDLPMIINRARVLGVRVPDGVVEMWKGRPGWNENIFDTLEILSFGKAFDGNGVDDVARALGLPPKLGHGSDFPALWKASRESAIKYNQRDVEVEIGIARACGLA